MRRALVLFPSTLVVVLLLAAAEPVLGADRLEKSAQKQKTKIAKVWLDLARHLVGRDLKTEAEDAIAKAKALDPELKDLASVAERVEALEGAGEMDASTKSRLEKAKKDAAKGYDKLAKVFEKESGDARYSEYLTTAIALDPSKSRISKLAGAAKKNLLLMRAPGHPFAALVSFPKAWKPGKEVKVLVSVEGAGCGFTGNARKFKDGRGSRPFITVSPHALSCTNQLQKKKFPAYSQATLDEWNAKRTDFDIPGLLGLLDFLRDHFAASEKIAITGFSGGGNLCYGFLLHHPDRVFCAAPACANFNPGLARGAAKPTDGGPPIHIMTGANDKHREFTHGNRDSPGIEPQSDWAEKALAENGFTKVKRTLLPGVGHSPIPRKVWEYVDEILDD